MADILEEIVAHKRIEIEQRKRFIQPRQMITLTEQKMHDKDAKSCRKSNFWRHYRHFFV